MNLGNLVRIAHAFDASFFFSVAPHLKLSDANSDTSRAHGALPFYSFERPEDFRLPLGCRLVGVEITDEAIELPSFRHPRQAAYILGAEREGLSAEIQSRCDYVVKIPTAFSVNLGVAGALIMYDRLLVMGRHAPRPVAEGAPTEATPLPLFGDPVYKRKQRARQRAQAKT